MTKEPLEPSSERTVTGDDRSSERSQPLPFEQLGDFQILHELGRGGMGVVYEARQVSLNRRVALKVLPPGLGLSHQATERFEREARAAAKLHHTNIVPVHAIGEDGEYHYFAMDLIEGQGLDRVLNDLRGGHGNRLLDQTLTAAIPSGQTPMSAETGSSISQAVSTSGGRIWFDAVSRLIAEVAEALDYAHSRGVVHRDIKPANLLFSAEGRLCIADFGLARLTQEPGMTVSGSLLGTPAYMSPEQVSAGRLTLDHRTDVYSLGAVLYEILTLQRPIRGDTQEQILSQIPTVEPIAPRRLNPKIPSDLETICLKALEKSPDQRYQTAGDMAWDLRQHIQHGLIKARRAGPVRRTWKFVRRHPLLTTVVVAAVLVAALTGIAGSVWREGRLETAHRSVADARYFLTQGDYRKGLESIESAVDLAPSLPDARLLRARLLIMLNREREAADEAEMLLRDDPDDWTAHLILAMAARAIPTMSPTEHVAVVEARAPETAEAYHLRALVTDSASDAVELLNRGLELDPSHAGALLERARRYVDLKDFQAALFDGERLLAVRPRSAQGRRLIGWIYHNLHEPNRALEELARAIHLDPDDPAIYSQRAAVYNTAEAIRREQGPHASFEGGNSWGLTGHTEEALVDLTRAIGLDPDYAGYYQARAAVYYSVAQYEDAIRDAQKALELNPDSLDTINRLGYSYFRLGRTQDLQVLVEGIPAVIERLVDPVAKAGGHSLLSNAYQAFGLPDLAFQEAERAIAADPQGIQNYMLRAFLRRRQGDNEGADADCARAAGFELEEPDQMLLRGHEMWGDLNPAFDCGRPDLAMADYSKAIEFAPRWADPYVDRAKLLRRLKRFDESLSDLSRAIELAPGWVGAVVERGIVHGEMDRFEEALTDFDRAFEIGGEGANLRWQRAQALLRLGRVDEGLSEIDQAIALAPDSMWPCTRKALALLRLGRVAEAMQSIERAIAVEPANPYPYLDRAAYRLFEPDQCEDAIADLETAEELSAANWSGFGYRVSWFHTSMLFYACPDRFDPARALELARWAVEQNPLVGYWHDGLGLALLRNGQYGEARQVLLKALELEPQPAVETLFSLAVTEWQLGRELEARTYYDKAVERMQDTYPAHPEFILRKVEAATLIGLAETAPQPH